MAYNLKIQKRENGRGTFTPKIHELSEKLLGRQMTITELRLLPYLDSCIKDFNILGNKLFGPKVNDDEIEFIHWLEEQGHVLWQGDKIMVTKEFYDFMKEVLWESYVELYLDQR